MTVKHPWIIGLFFLGLVVFGGLGWFGWNAYVQQNAERWAELERQKQEANRQVESFADQLHGDRDGKNNYKYHHFHGEVPIDPWGNALRITYQSTGIIRTGERVIVVSAGPDGVFDTRDDIKTERKTR